MNTSKRYLVMAVLAAMLFLTAAARPPWTGAAARAPASINFAPTGEEAPDLGDAPDSDSNHHGMNNTAYPGPILGHFPTVWNGTPASEPAGPLHMDATQVWLGEGVSFEMEADLLPDADPQTNILDNGNTDIADQDQMDDGWLNRGVPLPHCQQSMLKVRVYRASTFEGGRIYLNVWFDGNRDGDWQDMTPCADLNAYEWIVQNFIVDTAKIPPGGYKDILVPTTLIVNRAPGEPAYLRFTLSEQPAPQPAPDTPADGRGPHPPEYFQLGETEDYLLEEPQGGEPGALEISKSASVSAVDVGDVFTYSVILEHLGGTGPAYTVMTDTLPAPLKIAGSPTVKELVPHAAPLTAYYDASAGPSGTVYWAGYLSAGSPGGVVRIDIPVRLVYCPQQRAITNVAEVLQTDGTILQASASVSLTCDEPQPPEIELTKRILLVGEDGVKTPVTTTTGLPGDEVQFVLRLINNSPLTHTVHVSDDLPSGLIGVGAHTNDGVVHLINGGHTVVWDGDIGPANSPVHIWIRAKLTDAARCEREFVNRAVWRTRFFAGEGNEVVFRLRCWDLGDAPDSSNHFSTPMTAYAFSTGVVTGSYPTVYAVNPPAYGPAHRRPVPLHLGRRVSFETEADVGMDADGVHNLTPPADKADQDRFDDGLNPNTVKFTHCQYTRIPVLVNVMPGALPMLGQTDGFAYLNLWLDSNRDGDWNDEWDCPGVSGVHEHIVVDHPVNVAALGPGLHVVYVTTHHPVFWPNQWANEPAWLRVTLSERLSNKTLSGGTFGDGRGYKTPFLLGETEDYAYYDPEEPSRPADPTVGKRGRLFADHIPGTAMKAWTINWAIHYKNSGAAAAQNVKIVDTYAGDQTLAWEYSVPPLTPVIAGKQLTYTVGTLAAGSHGFIGMRAHVPFTTAPGTVVTNTVVIQSDNDSDATNNTAVVTKTIPLLPPVIIYPRPGTLCTNTLTVTGRAQVGTLVDLYLDGALLDTLTPDAQGQWSRPVALPGHVHDFHAVARTAGGLTSPPTPKVLVVVEPALSWNPLSLRFHDDSGHVALPGDASGRMDEAGWGVFLRGATTYTATVGLCCTDPNAQVTLEVMGVGTINLTDPDGDRVFEGSFTTPANIPAHWTVRLCVTCYLVQRCSDGEVLIDPEGTVFDLTQGTELAEATVGCYEAQTDQSETTSFNLWNAADYGQINPQTTAGDGYFSFFTPPGTYQLEAAKSDYQPYRSWEIPVVDEPVHYDIPLTPELSATPDYTVTVNAGGFDPAVLRVPPGAVVTWLNTDARPHTTTSLTPTVTYTGTSILALESSDGWDSGLLDAGDSYVRQLDTLGTYTYYDHENPAYMGVLVVEYKLIYLPLVMRNSD